MHMRVKKIVICIQVDSAAEVEGAMLFAAQCVVRGFVDFRCLLCHLPALHAALGSTAMTHLLTSACAKTAAGTP